MWSVKFKARAGIRKYLEVMNGSAVPPKSTEQLDETKATDAPALLLRKANETGYNELLLSCNEEVSFGFVDEAKTTNSAKGWLKTAWANMFDK